MKIRLTSTYVNDQEKALRFYTEVLGFVKKADFTQGPFRWLTVASGLPAGAIRAESARGDVFRGRRPARIRPDEAAGGGVHHAADQGDRFDDCQAERHVWQPDPDHRPRPMEALIG